jgi:NAD(P)-dependent dehydrogenase (short-subunit alcohol dehydrogenase family)
MGLHGMSAHWLTGRAALVAGEGEAGDIVAAALLAAGASVARCDPAGDHDTAAASLAATGLPVSILVHAGQSPSSVPAHEISPTSWRDALALELDSRFFLAAALARQCIAQKSPASILFLASPEQAGGAAQAAAGGALQNLVKTLAVEWARDGIRVNAIVSRHVPHPQGEAQRNSLGALAAYLSSDYAAYITGALMGLDEV